MINCDISFNKINFIFHNRPVLQTDVHTLERRLMLTMDMILTKKKRIALDRKQNRTTTSKQGIWGMLSSVAQLRSSTESEFYVDTFNKFSKFTS